MIAMEELTGQSATSVSPASLTLLQLQTYMAAGDLITMYQNFSNLAFTGENESPADLEGAASQVDQDNNLNIGGQGVLTPAQGASIGLTAPGIRRSSLKGRRALRLSFFESR